VTAAPRVRDATLADAGALAPLLGELGYPVEAADLAPRLARMLDRADQKVLIAEDGRGAALGLIAVHVFPALEYAEDIALITALVITEGARGTGAGRMLVDGAEAYARAAGVRRFLVTTHNRRSGAHAFYERLGFEFTGRRYVKDLGAR
jgi:N-acetylglutamate synthase-like GNAT family acetyltransferase